MSSDHIPQAELENNLENAALQVELGAVYAHYKDRTKHYTVTGFAIWEPTDETAVLYQAKYNEKLTFARPLSAFVEVVEHKGETTPRFTQIES